MRFVELEMTSTAKSDGSAVLHVNNLPPNPAVLAPGPALLFVVINGVPSIGQMVTVGSGQVGTQTVQALVELPPTTGVVNDPISPSSSSSNRSGAVKNSALSLTILSPFTYLCVIILGFILIR